MRLYNPELCTPVTTNWKAWNTKPKTNLPNQDARLRIFRSAAKMMPKNHSPFTPEKTQVTNTQISSHGPVLRNATSLTESTYSPEPEIDSDQSPMEPFRSSHSDGHSWQHNRQATPTNTASQRSTARNSIFRNIGGRERPCVAENPTNRSLEDVIQSPQAGPQSNHAEFLEERTDDASSLTSSSTVNTKTSIGSSSFKLVREMVKMNSTKADANFNIPSSSLLPPVPRSPLQDECYSPRPFSSPSFEVECDCCFGKPCSVSSDSLKNESKELFPWPEELSWEEQSNCNRAKEESQKEESLSVDSSNQNLRGLQICEDKSQRHTKIANPVKWSAKRATSFDDEVDSFTDAIQTESKGRALSRGNAHALQRTAGKEEVNPKYGRGTSNTTATQRTLYQSRMQSDYEQSQTSSTSRGNGFHSETYRPTSHSPLKEGGHKQTYGRASGESSRHLPPLYRHPQNLHRSGGGAAQTNCEPRSGSPNTVSGTKSKSPVKNKYSTERSVSSRRVGSDHSTKKMAETVVPNYDRTSMSEIEWESHMNNHPATVWYKLNSDADVKAAEIDDAQLDRLFRVDLSNHRHFIGRAAGGVSIVISQERCAYGERVLSTLDLSLSELTETIDSFDKDRMTSKQVRDIIQILPSFEEQEAIREYLDTPDGDFSALHRYEKFVAAMNIIEHVGVKLESILFMQSLSSSIERLRHYFLVVNRSCEEVLASTKLRKILGIVLKIGNRVNFKAQREQNNRSETFAITLDSLPKLKETQTSDRKTTFMHVLIKTIIRSGSAPLLDFKEDMPSIFGNKEMMSWRSAEAEMNRIEFGIDKLREFAVELSTRRIKPMSPHDEVKFLQKSIVGKFILHACLRMAVLVNEYDFAKMKFKSLLRYFGEACSHDRRQPDGVFSIIQTFAHDFDHAYADVSERAENIEFRRNFCSDPHVLPRHPTRQIASPETKRPMILGIEKRSRCDSRDEESMMQNYWGLPWRGADRDDVEVGEI